MIDNFMFIFIHKSHFLPTTFWLRFFLTKCNGEATTHNPPFVLPEESGSDSDAHLHSYPAQTDVNIAPNTSASSISKVDTNTSTTFASASRGSRGETIRKYPSSSRISTTSSLSQVSSAASQNSRISSVSTSSWHSAGTGAGILASSATSLSEGPITPISPPANISFPYPLKRGGSSGPSEYPFELEQSSFPTRVTAPPHIPAPPPLSSFSPPFSALPPLPISNPAGVRSDSPVHSLMSEFPERTNKVWRPAEIEQQEISSQAPAAPRTFTPQPSHHRQSHPHPMSTNHSTNPHSPPPRPPRSQNRPLSPEPATQSTKHFEHPRTPPRTPPQYPQVQGTTAGSGVTSFNSRSSQSHPQAYHRPSSITHSQLYSSYLYPSHSTHLTHVHEEEERQPEPGGRIQGRRGFHDGGSHGYGDGGEADAEPDADADAQSVYHASEIEYDPDQEEISKSISGQGLGDRDVREDSDRGSIEGSEAHGGGGRSIWSPYTSFLPSLATAPGVGKGEHQLSTYSICLPLIFIVPCSPSRPTPFHYIVRKNQMDRKRFIGQTRQIPSEPNQEVEKTCNYSCRRRKVQQARKRGCPGWDSRKECCDRDDGRRS